MATSAMLDESIACSASVQGRAASVDERAKPLSGLDTACDIWHTGIIRYISRNFFNKPKKLHHATTAATACICTTIKNILNT
mmetsp:Transcript_4586/g.11807  ORF Transcript_4586/g.11807 Transcript_4586/m.11807 type:complete len:82 (-) Transcript_4586:374-619(-)